MDKTSPKPFAFVLMPLSPDFDDVYQLGIKPACGTAGAYAERVDEQIFHESILQRIYNQISKADVIIADMTGRNPNVFYETGYAHALGKPVILLTQTPDDIPFDLKHYPHIIYGGRINDLLPELAKRVTFAIERPRQATEQHNVDVYVEGASLRETPLLIAEIEHPSFAHFRIRFDFHNSVNTRVKTATFQIGILISNRITDVSESGHANSFFVPYVQPHSAKTLLLDSKPYNILPGGWQAAFLVFQCDEKLTSLAGEMIDVVLRIFTQEGPFDFPFTIQIPSLEQKPSTT